MNDVQHAPAAPEEAHRQREPAGADVLAEAGSGARHADLAVSASGSPPGARPRPSTLPPGAMGAAALLGLQRLAGNVAATALVQRDGRHAARPAASPARTTLQRVALGQPADVKEAHGSNGAGGGPEAGPRPEGRQAEPTRVADAAQAGGGDRGRGEAEVGGEPPGGAGSGADARKVDASAMDEQTAALVADFAAEFGSRLGEVKGRAAMLADPMVRSAAARLVPDRRELGAAAGPLRPAPEDEASALLAPPTPVQREGPSGVKIPVQKVKVTLPNWPKIPLFQDQSVGSWFLLSGSIESPAYEGEAKPPDNIRDDTTEQQLQLTADGKVTGYAATLHKETIAKSGNAQLEGKVAVEVTDKSVKVSGLSLKLPDLGGGSNVLLAGQFDFNLLEWPVGEPPGVMVLSYTQKFGVKSDFSTDGWVIKGQLSLPIKVSIKPNPVKVAEFVARVIGPRLAVAAPAGLAIGAPLVAGGICVALWVNAIRAGQDIAKALDSAKLNTLGYVTAYFNTIMGYTSQRYSNEGAAAGRAAAQQVLDGLRFGELPAGAQAKIRAEYIEEGTMNLGAVQAAMWQQYRAAAIAWYRKEHDWDAWAYDKGLPSDLASLVKSLDIVGPPWPASAY